MNYIGQKVKHFSTYGEGIITEQDDSYITVQFSSPKQTKIFAYPDCFKQFLSLLDENVAEQAKMHNIEQDIKKEEAKEKDRQERSKSAYKKKKSSRQTNSSERSIAIPAFLNIDDFYEHNAEVLNSEIAYLRENGEKRKKLFDGKLVESKPGRYIYSFESETELNLPDSTQISLWSNNIMIDDNALIIGCEEFVLIIATTVFIGDIVANIEFTAEPWRLLSGLIQRLATVRDNPSNIVRSIVYGGEDKIQFHKDIKTGQEAACKMSLNQPITFIWGPPGTGKTETLSKIVLQHLDKGYRVLMMSYSNVSVDGAILRVFKNDKHKKPGKLVRYGYPRDKELLSHEYLTSYNLSIKNHPYLENERKQIIEEKKHLSRSSAQYMRIERRLAQIRKQLDAEEKEAVRNASFVATTVSKAIVDELLYNGHFDTVIFDEASMAYIPQVVFSASLAKKHFICIGDFEQLPPIVQSSDTNFLNADIFKYCGITEAVDNHYGHEWLCMLDTQYRMHPEIADFSSRNMYHGLLKTRAEIKDKREQIKNSQPFAGEVLQLADLSGMLSVCIKTRDQSRINVLSALISMGLALQGAKKSEVGIITPYSAQSRLLHAMAKDAMEQYPKLKKITCATVHQFQGSEKDIIIYDAVDCYRRRYPGKMLTSKTNNLANRLYNVALTRAKGKMISVANVDYMVHKELSSALIFRKMISFMKANRKVSSGDNLVSSIDSKVLKTFNPSEAAKSFLKDINSATSQINIDIPTGMSGDKEFLSSLSQSIASAKDRGVHVYIRTNNIAGIPKEIKKYVIENQYVTDPVVLVDKMIVWYGMPISEANFIIEEQEVPTLYKPIIRFVGKSFARSLYGYLEMNNILDSSTTITKDGDYHTFASYVKGNFKCEKCGAIMQLKKSRKNTFFLGCSTYPKCDYTELIDPEMVEEYLSSADKDKKCCSIDKTSLIARKGSKGIYVCCSGRNKHYYGLDEI